MPFVGKDLKRIAVGRIIRNCIFAIFCVVGLSSNARAGDGATLIFNSGIVVEIDDGYSQLINSLKSLDSKTSIHKVVELNLGGGTFLVNVSEIVVLCRDKCKNMTIKHQLDPARAPKR